MASADINDDVLYSMLYRVVEKRKTYPSIIMNKERDRLSSELQRWELMKVELDDDEVLQKQTKIAAEDAKRLLSKIETEIDLKTCANNLLLRQSNLDEITLYMNLRHTNFQC